ncbi:MAG: acetyl-CoA carboxylase biotin carboxylase subunit [Dehalococcoidia bacterium]|nr:acetyl-CoA carboxylase biotin carboxylase subunit [Dehalococcoidia bacterium]MDW8120553.1 acetyl-CoA carboxylase biotin carboxylase subunit [Chloroflexota bacterium]
MFRAVLVANRGECACRIIRTLKRMGIRAVAVYSEADTRARHVQMADEAVPIGPPEPAQSYLNIPRLVEAARATGCQAVHPGWGFLAQNPAFARACAQAGLKFIGPRPEVMERMGDKVLARHLAREAGLPLAPGSPEAVTDEEAVRIAQAIGFPVMIKAAAGGGGVGIRVATSLADLRDLLPRARRLAQGAFGSDKVYVERYIRDAAHIEVQVLGDEHGTLVHLGERECSVQRRNQKIVEETPSPKLNDAQRQRLVAAALALARHIGYTNAGTVEFLWSPEGEFYFLEMNTRLQVEHPVTEMVTGLDIVELQVRIAMGEPLPFRQEDVVPRGHSVEGRVYAEDPDTFVPTGGTVERVVEPQGEGIRVDSALVPGYQVPLFYDAMLAKVIAWAPTREQAIARLDAALKGLVVEGVRTNIPTLRAVLGDPTFLLGTYTTQVLARLTAVPQRRVASTPTSAAVSTDPEAVLHEAERRSFLDPRWDGRAEAVAAALAVAWAWEGFSAPAPSAWREQGKMHQMLTRLGVGL